MTPAALIGRQVALRDRRLPGHVLRLCWRCESHVGELVAGTRDYPLRVKCAGCGQHIVWLAPANIKRLGTRVLE